MTGDEYRAIREALGLSRPGLAELIGGSGDGSLIKKREAGEVAITAAAEAEIVALKAACDAGRPLAGAAAEAGRAKRSLAASQPAATPLHAARLLFGISQDEMLYQLGKAGECKAPARSTYQAWERGRRSTPQWVLDAADDLEKNRPFEAPPAEATPTAAGWQRLAVGVAISVVAIGGVAWLATPQRVFDAADDLEKNGPFEAPPAEATPTAAGWQRLAVGVAVIVAAMGGIAWLAARAGNAA
jgi:transcriptional regulator with XRE-family HTH domain